jgi:hypothetical protein
MLCLFGPFLYYIPTAFVEGQPGEKLALSLAMVVALILGVFTLLAEATTRGGLAKTIMWCLVLGVCFCIPKVETFVYIMAIISIIDELVITKLRDHYKTAYTANEEIDRRD